MRLELIGFAPDLDPHTPGVLTDCDAIIPTNNGFAAPYAGQPTPQSFLAGTPTSAFVAELLDGSKRLFAATATNIYEAAASSWTLRSRVGAYTGLNRQRFCVFGNVTLAANRSEAIGQAAAGGSFVDIAGAPAAAIVVTASGFVLAFDTNDGTYGDRPDGWWCSGIRDHTVWTPAAATQSANGRLLDSPGRVTAAAALGSDVVAYKGSSMYLGQYVGPDIIWAWTRVPGNIGTSGNESVVVVDTAHYFVGPNDFYVYDGTVPRSFGESVRNWFFSNLNPTYRDKVIGTADIARNLIYWYYPSTASASGALDSAIIYNYKTGQWGKWARPITTAVLYSSGQTTYDSMGTTYATWDDLPSVAYDSPFWSADRTVPAIFIATQMYSLTGTPRQNWLVTSVMGDSLDTTMLRRVTPRYVAKPVSATATNYYADNSGTEMTADVTNSMSDGRFDFRRAARFHKVRIDHPLPGPMTIKDIEIEAVPAGRR